MTPIIRICSQPGCGQPTTHPPHCPQHATLERKRRQDKTHAAGYHAARWQLLRGIALRQAGHACSRCGASRNLTVHLDPSLKGNHHIAQLEDCTVLCRACHGAIDAPRSHSS